ncbi:transposase [Larkinella sp. C7]|jgi:putative transposase|uniref:transposase n=1 Tax=Larkinella sp. C7 TaxID=2576607 RepID=UPI00111146C7|nr:transposase [Larkinella sp. C7]
MEKQTFDFDAFKKSAVARLKAGDSLLGRDGVLTPLLKEFLEQTLEGELEAHLQEEGTSNRKNGKVQNRLKTFLSPVEMATPRDRNGTFEPEMVAKRQWTLGADLDRQIIALYARGALRSILLLGLAGLGI